jgi:hypothetical protein
MSSLPQDSPQVNSQRLNNHNNARKTHCKRGHPFTPENTYMSSDGKRRCRACIRPRALAVFDCLCAQPDGITALDVVIRVWGADYIRADWRNNFDKHLSMARKHAVQQGLEIVRKDGVLSLRPSSSQERAA